jgi:CHAT domain-containing protein
VIVAMPDTPGAPSLPGASHETRRLTSLLPGATVLRGHRATHDAVTAALPRHAVAHFSCHGVSEWTSPDTSRLLLHDHTSHPLTVTAVSRLHLTHADLAYLSACSTTDTHPTLADEAVHITAAFQLAGYRNVIGTLWPIDDHTATRIAVDVYTRLTDHGTRPPHTSRTALALHHAIRRIRTDYLATPTLWAAHIHTGT